MPVVGNQGEVEGKLTRAVANGTDAAVTQAGQQNTRVHAGRPEVIAAAIVRYIELGLDLGRHGE